MTRVETFTFYKSDLMSLTNTSLIVLTLKPRDLISSLPSVITSDGINIGFPTQITLENEDRVTIKNILDGIGVSEFMSITVERNYSAVN